jgi:hypothetical protein
VRSAMRRASIPGTRFRTPRPSGLEIPDMKAALITLLAFLAVPVSAALASPCPTVQWELTDSTNTVGVIERLSTMDVNEDGFLDFLGRRGGALLWWPGNGDGTFDFAQTLIVQYLVDFAVGDFTGDARTDIAAFADGKLLLFPGTGSGRGPVVEQTATSNEYRLQPLQYDVDPELELVAWETHGDVTILDRVGPAFMEILRITPASLYKLSAADVDGDGRADLIIGDSDDTTIYFGASVSPYGVSLSLAGWYAATGDLDGDGDLDLVASDASQNVLHLHRNDGSRTFTSSIISVAYSAGVDDVLLTDVTGDGRADLLTQLSGRQGNPLMTFSGDQSGTLRQPPTMFRVFEGSYSTTSSFATGDFTGDGAPDLVFSQGVETHIVRPGCGTQVQLQSDSFHLSTGTTLKLEVSVAGFHPSTAASPGTIDLLQDDSVIASQPVDPQGFASFNVSGLSSGDYWFTATFSGNSDLAASESNVVPIRISDAVTTLTLVAPLNHVYGTPVPLRIESDDALSNVRLSINGAESPASTNVDFTRTLNAGTHSMFARFPGDNDHPAARSQTVTVNVAKAPSTLRFISGQLGVRAGQAHQLSFTVTYAAAANLAQGTVTLRKDGAVIGSANLSTGLTTVSATLPEGSHKVVATYEGTANIRGTSETIYLDVFAGTGLLLRAHSAPGYIQINAAYPANTINVWLYRRPAGTSTWSYVAAWDSNTGRDSSVTPGIIYEYRMEAEDNAETLFESNSDRAIVFSNDPLAVRTTAVQTKHFTELRDMINVLRAKASLPPFTFHSSFGTGKPVLAAHVVSLYNALLQAYGNLGMGTPPFTPVSNGQPIRALQMQQLRDALR